MRKLMCVTLLVAGLCIALGFVSAADGVDASYLAQLSEGNLLPNPDFELPNPDNATRPMGWEATYRLFDFNQPVWDDTTAYSGTHSLKMAAPMDTEAVWRAGMIPVKPKTEYVFSGFVKTENIIPGPTKYFATFFIEQFNEKGAVVFPCPAKAGESLQGTHDWTKITFQFTTAAKAASVQVSGVLASMGRARGTAWFDAVKLEEVKK